MVIVHNMWRKSNNQNNQSTASIRIYAFRTSGRTTCGSLNFGLSEYKVHVKFLQSKMPIDEKKTIIFLLN